MERLRLLLLLALRNLRRQARRSILTAAAMVLGVAALILSRSLSDGAHETWVEAALRLGAGHITIQHPAFLPRRALEDRLAGSAAAAALAAVRDPAIAPNVLATATRLEVRGLATSPRGAVPVMILGVDPATESAFSQLDQRLSAGAPLAPGDRLHAYVGVGLARRLRLEIGDRLVLTGQAADSAIVSQLVRVAGTFRTGLPEADDGLVHIPLATAQEWLGVGDDVTGVAVLLRSSYDVPRVLGRLREALAAHDAAAVLPWQETTPELDSAIRLDDYGDWIFHAILFLIVTLAIVNTVLMAVLSRTREFGILRAVGLRRRDTAALVLLEGSLLTVAAGIVGLIVGFGGTWLFLRHGLDLSGLVDREFTAAGALIDPVMVPRFRLAHLAQGIVFMLVIGVLASLYPAWRATRIEVAEAMKFEG
jgi:ABC-type lipoprotein release transport system permease subunit